MMRIFPAWFLVLLLSSPAWAAEPARSPGKANLNPDFEFLDSSFENASPLWYDIADDGWQRAYSRADGLGADVDVDADGTASASACAASNSARSAARRSASRPS